MGEIMMGRLIIIGLCAVLPLILVKNAYAYIDLSVGSMLIQGLIVAFVSIGIFWRRFWSFLGRLFGRKKEE